MPSIDRAPAAHDKDTWTLESRRLVLRDAEFEGLVGVETATGRKRLLKFTARSLEAADLDLALQRGAATWHLKVGAGTIATAGGPMTLYAERLVGKALRLGGSAAAPRRRVTITPSSVPQWLSTPVPAAQNARHRMVTIEGAALYRIRLTGDGGRGKLPIPCAVSIPCGP